MPLIGYLAASRSNVQHLIEAGLMDDCVNIIKDPTVDEDISREAMETLIKFTSIFISFQINLYLLFRSSKSKTRTHKTRICKKHN